MTTMNRTSRNWSGDMNTKSWKALGVTAALLLLNVIGCTDPTVAPQSTVTGANFFNDPGSYRAFLAKIYVGLAVGGQNSGGGSTDILRVGGRFSQDLRLDWDGVVPPTDQAERAWGAPG